MKRIVWLLAMLTFVAPLSACGDDPDDDVEAEGKKPSSDDDKEKKPDSSDDEKDCHIIVKLSSDLDVEACAEEEKTCGTVRVLHDEENGYRCCLIGGNCEQQ